MSIETTTDATSISVSANTIEAWRYVFRSPRPHIHPLTTPAGVVLTRDAPDDHPWHHALWFTIKFVNGENFWEEYGPRGILRHDEPPSVRVEGDTVRLEGTVRWVGVDRETVVINETREIVGQGRTLDLRSVLVPTTDVVLDRTPFTTWGGYGGLTFRGRPDLVDSRLLLADGSVHDRVHGVDSEWLDLSGTVEGAPVGVAMFADPAGRFGRVPWYGSTRADTYGNEGWSNFFNAAFLWHGPLEITAGEPLEICHRVIAHDGIWSHDEAAAAYSDYRSGRGGSNPEQR